MVILIEVQKQRFHRHNRLISIKRSNKVFFGKKGLKYLIGYKEAKKIRPCCIVLTKMSAYRKDFDETKHLSFLIKDDKLLEK